LDGFFERNGREIRNLEHKVRLIEQIEGLLGEFKTKVKEKNISKPTLETIYIYVKLLMLMELKRKLCHEKMTIVKGKTFPCFNTCKYILTTNGKTLNFLHQIR